MLRHVHRIPLIPDAAPVVIRPYRYPPFQKTEIYKQIKEMLQSRVIRHSCSSYTSPIIFVKKKDEAWCLGIDYRALNVLTIKDKFPIPLVDDLLDELSRANIFSKLDLRSGYHLIRTADEDVHKTAFRTHKAH